MAGPWEDYTYVPPVRSQAAPTAPVEQEGGPWAQYETAPEAGPWAQYGTPEPSINEQAATAQKTSEELGLADTARGLVAETAAVGDFLTSLPAMLSQAVGEVGHVLGGAAAELTGQAPPDANIWKEARQYGQEMPVTQFLSNPVSKFVKGIEAVTNTHLMGTAKIQEGLDTINSGLEKAADVAGQTSDIPGDAYLVAGDILMTALGAKGTAVSGKAIAEKLSTVKPKAQTGSPEAMASILDDVDEISKPEAPVTDKPTAAQANAMIDKQRQAEAMAYRLLQEGASAQKVASAIKKNASVGTVLERMRSDRENFTAAFTSKESSMFNPLTELPPVGENASVVAERNAALKFYRAKEVEAQASAQRAEEGGLRAIEQLQAQEQLNKWAQEEMMWKQREAERDPLYAERLNNPNFDSGIRPFVLDNIPNSDINAGGSRLMASAFRAAGLRHTNLISRAYEHGDLDAAVAQLKNYNDTFSKEAGKVSPKLLMAMAAAGVGGTLGAYIANDNKLRGFFYGGLFGAALPYARDLAKSIAPNAEKLGGVISTSLANISPALRMASVEHERLLFKNGAARYNVVKDFVDGLSKLKTPVHDTLATALRNNDHASVKAELVKIGDMKLAKGYVATRKMLDSVGKELVALGLVKSLRENYFPRMVKDVAGLKAELGASLATNLQKELDAANTASMKAGKGPLSDMETSNIINSYIKRPEVRGKPGFTKQRKLGDVPPELAKYYHTPGDALLMYVNTATQSLERARFFGKHLKIDKTTSLQTVDLDGSISDMLTSLIKNKKLKVEDVDQAKTILETMFKSHGKAHPVIEWAKDIGYAGILAQFTASLTQLGDVFTSGYAHGYANTAVAAAKVLTKKSSIDFDATGLAHKLSHELSTTSGAAKFVQSVFKSSGFSAVDYFGKRVSLQAAFDKYTTAKGAQRLVEKYKDSLSRTELAQAVKDFSTRTHSDITDSILFAELSDVQPISKMELPKAYLEHPNGRLLYMFKSFTIKQLDIARRDGFNEIKKGNYQKGITNLTKLALTLGISGASTAWVTNYILGSPVDMSWGAIADNVTRTFGWSKYNTAMLQQGKPLQAVASMALPPYRAYEEILKVSPKAIQYLPVVGKFLYYRFYGGAEAATTYKEKAAKQTNKTEVTLRDVMKGK